MTPLKLGVALGSGAARGWAHFGVIRALERLGLHPDVVSGASIGSLVAAAWAGGQVDRLEQWVLKLQRIEVVRLLDTIIGRAGLIEGNRLMAKMAELIDDRPIDALDLTYGAVATDLHTGGEVWLREGPVLSAVRASCGLPGLFVPVRQNGRWLIDGGVVNPVPVSLCNALGADVVIAVNLNSDALDMHRREREVKRVEQSPEEGAGGDKREEKEMLESIGSLVRNLLPNDNGERKGSAQRPAEPSMFEVLASTLAIMQDRLTRSRMAGEPPVVQISPRLGDMPILDFHRASAAIEEGEAAVERERYDLEYVRRLLGRDDASAGR